jgi:hypothetical protein
MEPAAKLILWMAGRTNRQRTRWCGCEQFLDRLLTTRNGVHCARQRMLLDAQQQPLAPLCA